MNRIYLLAFLNILVMPLNAYAAEFHQFEIISGRIQRTPARCLNNNCISQKAKLFGTFIAEITGNSISFSNIHVSSTPNLSFNLPANPNVSGNGTTNNFDFRFDENWLIASGIVDSRAFDGPLEKYSFVAKKITISNYQEFEQNDFFSVRRDSRKCPAPQCGGYYVKKVNDQKSQCADGQFKDECYVSFINYEKIGLNNIQFQQSILLQGEIQPAPLAIPDDGDLQNTNPLSEQIGIFIAKAAYRPTSRKKPNGVFVGLQDNGIRCATAPCFSTDQYILNHDEIRMISDYNLEETGASKKLLEQAYSTIAKGGVVIASGINMEYESVAGAGINFVADQFYMPIRLLPRYQQSCPKGYEFSNGTCKTPIGCNYPKLELWVYGGTSPDNATKENNIAKSCVSSCIIDFDDGLPPLGGLDGPGKCSLYIK